VIEANLAPVLAPIGDEQLALGETLTFTATATDEDGPAEELTFSLGPDAPAGAAIHPVSGAFRWRPVEAQDNARHLVTVTVSDGGAVPKSDSATFSVTVGQPNLAPLLTRPADQKSMPGEKVALVVLGVDPDKYPQALAYRAANLPPGLSIDPSSGVITGKVGFDGLDGSPFSVEVSLSDGRSTTSVEFTWAIVGLTAPPRATSTRAVVVAEIVDIASPPFAPEAASSEVVRSFVVMSRALRGGVGEMSLPFLFLALAMGALIAFGRIGIVPVLRRGTEHEGVIRRYDPLAGTGLVRRATDGVDVFVHSSAIARRDRSVLVPGDSVTFRTVDGAYRDLVTKLRRRR
jgi:cold shock CspA family protein